MIERTSYLDSLDPFIGKNIIKVLIGVRRSGKSTLMKQIQLKLLNQGIKEENIHYFNFESAQWSEITKASDLVKHVSKLVFPGAKHYLFFDEIQEVQGWEKALRSFMVDYDVDMYVTGSNAHLLSSDLATHITGRYTQIPVYPFSFKEFLEAVAAVELNGNSDLDNKKHFNRFVEQGGFPFQYELSFAKEACLSYLEDVYSTILFRDVVQRNALRDSEQLARIIRYVIQEAGHTFSANSIKKYLKSENHTISVDTVYSYLRAAEAACLIYRVGREDALGKKTLKFNEKYYLVDQGLRSSLGYDNASSIDQVLENIVYLELKRRGYKVSVGKVRDAEVDFIARKENQTEYYQVAYLLADEKVKEREFSSLEAIKDNYPKCVLSLDEFSPEKNGIKGQNLIDWLLA